MDPTTMAFSLDSAAPWTNLDDLDLDTHGTTDQARLDFFDGLSDPTPLSSALLMASHTNASQAQKQQLQQQRPSQQQQQSTPPGHSLYNGMMQTGRPGYAYAQAPSSVRGTATVSAVGGPVNSSAPFASSQQQLNFDLDPLPSSSSLLLAGQRPDETGLADLAIDMNLPPATDEMHLWEDISHFATAAAVPDPNLPVLNEDPIPYDLNEQPLSSVSLAYTYNPQQDNGFGSSDEDDSKESSLYDLNDVAASKSQDGMLAAPGAGTASVPTLYSATMPLSGTQQQQQQRDQEQQPRKPKRKRHRRRKLASQLSPEELQKTREINRVAAQRHRLIAKAKKMEQQKHFEMLAHRNEDLKGELRNISAEVMTLRRLVLDMYGPGGPRSMPFLQSGSNAHDLGL